ncbi:cyclic nucleotide-binding domain-containing protein [Streptomyces sp. NPDC047315]|uniref:cyclic nucleotide-binding domain-containing protein n=1 Tax=Streptomyces sp. NPDC047315 TaxID=3155142 RepID=UPI0033C2D923
MSTPTTTMSALSTEHRSQLTDASYEVQFAQGERLFDEGDRADRFWVVRTGLVTLDIRVPGRRRSPVLESLAHGELVGWSWMFPPGVWHLGAEAMTPVRALEFDAVRVRRMCEADPWFGHEVAMWVGAVLAHRLQAARGRLLDLYGSSRAH